MRRMKLILIAAGLGVALLGATAQAQGTTGTPPEDQWAQLRAYLESLKAKWDQKKDQLPDRPLPPLPEDIKKLVENARKAAKDFVSTQKELAQALKSSTDEERDKIREQMKTNLDAFKEVQKGRVEEIKKRLADIKNQFKDNHDRLIEAAKEQRDRGRPK